MASFRQDVRFGLRLLFRNPGHTLAAVIALGLGIGLATAMFSIVYGVAYRGLPVPEADRIMHVENANPSLDQPSLEVFLHDFLDIRERQRSLEGLSGYYDGTLNLSGDGGQPERFNGSFISANAFDQLRVKPVLGRGFLPGEDTPQAEPVAVLSYGAWKTRYQRDAKVIGRPVRINGEAGTIVGVMPEGFAFPNETEVWTPLRLDPLRIERGQGETLEVMGRLRDGVSVETARAEIQAIVKAIAAQYPKTNKGRIAVVKPWMEEAIGDEPRRLLWTMLGACLFVLLIACTNVASLMVARASRRTREIAIRASLGASRGRIIVQLLLESLLIALLGAGIGLLLARWGVQAFNSAITVTDPPFWLRVAVDPTAMLFTLGVTLLAALLSGLLPALQASKADVGEVLKDEGRGSSSLRLGRLSRFVVIGEVALSCLLLVGAGLMIRSVLAMRTVDLGFDSTHLLTARIALFESAYPKEADRVRFFDDLLERLASQPGVAAAARGNGSIASRGAPIPPNATCPRRAWPWPPPASSTPSARASSPAGTSARRTGREACRWRSSTALSPPRYGPARTRSASASGSKRRRMRPSRPGAPSSASHPTCRWPESAMAATRLPRASTCPWRNAAPASSASPCARRRTTPWPSPLRCGSR